MEELGYGNALELAVKKMTHKLWGGVRTANAGAIRILSAAR